MQVDLGRPVEIDQASLFLRDFMGHDKHWAKGELLFSDGGKVPFELDPLKAGAQNILFPKKTVTFVRVQNLEHPGEVGWSAMAEVQVFGRESPEK
jgi:hypothetical protein